MAGRSVEAGNGWRGRVGSLPTTRIDWPATLRSGRPRTLDDLARHRRRDTRARLWVVVLDTSASMLRGGALARAKGALAGLFDRLRRAGDRVTLIRFGAGGVEALVDAQRPVPRLRARVDALPAGGGTPLAQALLAASRELAVARDGAGPLVVFTDGRHLDTVAPLPNGIEGWVVDCESGPVRLGRAGVLGRQLGLPCVALTGEERDSVVAAG